LLDQNLYSDMAGRYANRVPVACRQLLGPHYVLLRNEFAELRRNMRQRDGRVKNILVFFGGVDLPNVSARVVEAIRDMELTQIHVNVVIGATNPHRKDMESLCRSVANVQLHIQVNNMAQLMADADLCVGAGGTASWERCCLGLPALALPIAENQQQLLHDAALAGYVYSPELPEYTASAIAVHIEALLNNPLLCQHMSDLGMAAVDGIGARRVANRLLSPEIELRLAGPDDMRNIYEWRNHIDVRKYSRDRHEIDFDQHQRWFANVMRDPGRVLLVASVAARDVGVLRYDITGDQAEVSIFLAPGESTKGYGAAMLDAGEKYLANHHAVIKVIVAETLPENRASQRLFESRGYQLNARTYVKRLYK
jgi:RimJ/RimL family protein N-acetyltransferase